jgi:glycosyltransferase involved in cell wall biosynthesis
VNANVNQAIALSIVTPTRGNFSEYWLEQLLKIQGDVEFVLVYHPHTPIRIVDDSRVKAIASPYKGEMMQRFVGLLNASGDYVLALDDDDFVHPDIVRLTCEYFQRFPQSWVLRLYMEKIDRLNEERIKQGWSEVPPIPHLSVCQNRRDGQERFTALLEIPIAPLDKRFDIRHAIFPFQTRTDDRGIHFENFNNRVWKNELVKQVLPDLSEATKVLGAITWIPSSGFDRLIGLFIQAKFYNKGAIIGHWMTEPEQIRFIDKPPSLKPPRFHVISDVLLVRCFPQYGYFWNLFFSKLYGVPRTVGKAIKMKLLK